MAEDGEAAKPHGDEVPVKGGNEAEPSAAVEAPVPPPSSGLPPVSLNIWPPSQRTRDAVIQRLIDTLSSSSVLTKRYGVVPVDEASATARLIEQEAFDFADSDGVRASASIDDGLEVLQIYSKEISKRMIESVKSRASPVSSTPAVEEAATAPAESASMTSGAGEETSAVTPESPSS
ncbi:MFP1 attachment factor 1-like [Musa acuminata AAA Group]|uniref:(wild Malaysian banana) hypothetical protein n=1 Tax=Musa acuminata subsp. malaccensis TaxID=214687 RepID=A0A804IPM7_MUSAM|nr:PREDICTED: MFP1 attachment factor 1-like [Musa acuminata subsp. malaccensis]XP_018679866.1 PREDICTED: MFP1 attachment factor 1-like [Musa acuminata subsp. malaccensis]CAG1842147.1 unnamed protein product [Musa acuminata subsp. malaccensis]